MAKVPLISTTYTRRTIAPRYHFKITQKLILSYERYIDTPQDGNVVVNMCNRIGVVILKIHFSF